MKKVILIFAIFVILSVSLFTLTGCSLTIETDENSVSASVDEETQGTFERIVDWIVERLHRVFDTSDSSSNNDGGRA